MCLSGTHFVPTQPHVCVSMCWVRASCRSMCAGTPTWRPCRTGPQCVRPDAKSTWQKQIMSAPVIFSSPSALQEPFKGPNTEKSHTQTHAYTMHVYSMDTHTYCTYTNCVTHVHHANNVKIMHLNARCQEKTHISNVTFLTVDIWMSSCTNPSSKTLTQTKTCIQSLIYTPWGLDFLVRHKKIIWVVLFLFVRLTQGAVTYRKNQGEGRICIYNLGYKVRKSYTYCFWSVQPSESKATTTLSWHWTYP